MKQIKFFLAVLAVAVCAMVARSTGIFAAFLLLFALDALVADRGSALVPWSSCRLTLSGTEILMKLLGAFKTVLPPLFKGFSTDFSAERAKMNQTVIARISQIPAVQDYDTGGGGYKTNAADSKTLMVDLPIVIDQWKHVPIKVLLADQAKATFNLAEEAITNTAYALGKSILDYALGKVLIANFSNYTQSAVADSNLAVLNAIRRDMNKQKADPLNRYGIVNSDVAANFNEDTRIGSRLFYGALNADSPLSQWNNLAGFKSIWEYPDLPANAQSLTGFFFDPRAIAIATRLPQDTQEVAAALGIPQIAKFEVVQDPDTGLALLGIMWIEPGTFDIYYTVAVMYGAVAGAQGGGANAIVDLAGRRLTTANA